MKSKNWDNISIGDSVEFQLAGGVYMVVDMERTNKRHIVKLVPASKRCSVSKEFWIGVNLLK